MDVVVATPGRAVDHLDRGTLRFDEVETVVLDEADEMLDMGFADDLDRILSARCPRQRQTALFSATISGPIARLAERAPARSGAGPRPAARSAAEGEPARVRQVAYVVRRADKLAALGRILDLEDGAATLVFARTRGEVDDLAEALSAAAAATRRRSTAASSQEQRDRIMGRFRDGALDVLVATDVAARGLDIEHITPRRQLRRALLAGHVRAPHRADRARRTRGRGDHARRAARAPAAAGHRAHDRQPARDRRPADGLRHARAPDGHAAGLAPRGAASPAATTGTAPSWSRSSDEFDLVDIALAAVSQADAEARGAEDTTELAPATLPSFDRPGAAAPEPAAPAARPPVHGEPCRTADDASGPRPVPRAAAGRQRRAACRPGSAGAGPAPTGRPGAGQGVPAAEPGRRRTRPSRPGARGPAPGFRVSGWHDAEGRPVLRDPAARAPAAA